MAPSSRDRISVDLRGLRAALFEQARARGVSPSDFVRHAVARSLDRTDTTGTDVQAPSVRSARDRVRLSLRLSSEETRALAAAAAAAGLPVGVYVAALAAGVPLLMEGGNRHDHLAALVASSAELATLIRNIHHLTTLLRQGNVRAALEYANLLKTLDHDIRAHLAFAAGVLADLRPRRRHEPTPREPPIREKRT